MATHRSVRYPREVVCRRFPRNASNPPPCPLKPAQPFWRFQPLPRWPARFSARKLFSPANRYAQTFLYLVKKRSHHGWLIGNDRPLHTIDGHDPPGAPLDRAPVLELHRITRIQRNFPTPGPQMAVPTPKSRAPAQHLVFRPLSRSLPSNSAFSRLSKASSPTLSSPRPIPAPPLLPPNSPWPPMMLLVGMGPVGTTLIRHMDRCQSKTHHPPNLAKSPRSCRHSGVNSAPSRPPERPPLPPNVPPQ